MLFHLTKAILNRYCEQNILFLFRHAMVRDTIIKDLFRWNSILKLPFDKGEPNKVLLKLFHDWPEFRNLFYFRLRKEPVRNHFIFFLTYKIYPPLDHLVIYCIGDIGPGLFIQHGRATGIVVRRIGENCWINQHVSIGYKHGINGAPIIGNNVKIYAGAKVYGNITVSDNVIIGANAVVVKDVPPDCTIVGVPGRIIKRGGRLVDEPL